MQEDDAKEAEKKRLLQEKMTQEIVEYNRISILDKQEKLAKEKEEDLRILKYNMEKAKKEEEELKEKKKTTRRKRKRSSKIKRKTGKGTGQDGRIGRPQGQEGR